MGVIGNQLSVINWFNIARSLLTTYFPIDRSVRIPSEDAERSGLAADQVKISTKYGGGFPANVEGLHHLHCLVRVFQCLSFAPFTNIKKNLLRQSLFYNYDYYHAKGEGPFVNDDYIVRHHVCTFETP